MVRKSIWLAVFVLWLSAVAGCTAVSPRVPIPDAGTPDVARVATADPTRGWVQTAAPTATALVPNTPQVSATVALPTSPTPLPTSVPAVTWSSFTSPKYGYTLDYPAEMSGLVENVERVGDAVQVERVVFKLPTYGPFGQSSAIAIEVGQRGYSRPVECQDETELVPAVRGCRRSFPSPQAVSQERVWFRVPATGSGYLYFSMQLIYDDLKYATALAHMLQTFRPPGHP